MSYSVEYNPESRDSYPIKFRKQRKLPINVILISMGILGLLYTLNSVGIMRYIIPGDPVVTTGAFTNMVEQVRNGHTVSDAIFNFFKDVITGGVH